MNNRRNLLKTIGLGSIAALGAPFVCNAKDLTIFVMPHILKNLRDESKPDHEGNYRFVENFKKAIELDNTNMRWFNSHSAGTDIIGKNVEIHNAFDFLFCLPLKDISFKNASSFELLNNLKEDMINTLSFYNNHNFFTKFDCNEALSNSGLNMVCNAKISEFGILNDYLYETTGMVLVAHMNDINDIIDLTIARSNDYGGLTHLENML